MSGEALTIDPSRMSEDEWLSAIRVYVRAAKDAGEVVNLRARPEFLTPQEAGERLGVSRTTAVRAIKSGELEATKVGNRHRIPVAAVDAYRKQLLDAAVARLTDGVDLTTPVPDDPVVVYDILHEAATRLGGLRLHLATTDTERDQAIADMRADDAEINAVAMDDLEAQKALTAELDRRYAALVRR